MSEIAVRPTNGKAAADLVVQDHAAGRLVEWAQAADAAYRVAAKLCGTQFAPQAYRNKPEEATAAILAGAEVGLSPMASLRAFDNIQGTPAPKALTLRAIVQSLGHDIRIVEATPTRAVVTGLRKGDPESERQTSTWTYERAEKAGYVAKNPNYKTKPTDMLVARATGEVSRWIAADAIMGMPYTAEEIRDEGGAFDAPVPVNRGATAAAILAAAAAPAPEPVKAEAQPQPVADDASARMVSDVQRKRMFALWGDLGFDGDINRDNRLTITAKILGLAGPLESSNDLTFDEAEQVIGALEAKKVESERRKAEAQAGGES